jgi:hypothetical protein
LLFVGFVLSQQGAGQPEQREDERAQPTAEQRPQQYELLGEVQQVSVADKTVRVRNPESNFVVPLAVRGDSRITLDGKPSSLEQIPEGAEVRASYAIEGDTLVARVIEVRSGEQQAAQPQAGTGAAGAEQAKQFQVEGNVQQVGARTIAIREPATPFLVDLVVPQDVKVTMEGRTIGLSEIPEGAEVRASYSLVGDDLVAESIAVSCEPQAPPAGGQPEIGPMPEPGTVE